MKRSSLNEYEREYLTDFIKSLKIVIYVGSHPEELKNSEFYYIWDEKQDFWFYNWEFCEI